MNYSKEKNFVSAVIYFSNDEKIAEKSINTVSDVLSRNFENYEIICVDDGSVDNTVEVIRNSCFESNCALTIVKMSSFQGREAAMSAGVNLSIGDYVFEFDTADFNFDSELIMKIYRKSQEGYDVVSGVDKNYKKLSSKLFYNLFNRGANLSNPVKSETLRVVSRRAINRVYSMGKFVKYRKALYANCGFKVTDVVYESEKKQSGKKRHDKVNSTETAITSMILFTDLAYKLSFVFSMLMMLATIATAVYTIIVFATKNVVEGFATTMLVISGSFFAVFVLFAIIIKYLSVLVQLVFNEREYMIESIEKRSK